MPLFVDQQSMDRHLANEGGKNDDVLQPASTNDALPEPFVDVEEIARIQLQHSPYRALRRVACEFLDGTLVLRGCVATYHYKQLAQVSVAEIPGVQRIINAIEVETAVRHEHG